MSEQIVIHREFPGEHDISDACWCQPIVTDSDDLRDAEEIAMESEQVNG